MLDKLNEGFSFRQEALHLRRERHEVLASNIANADTPGYKARDLDFGQELARATGGGGSLSLNATSGRHLGARPATARGLEDLLYRVPEQPSLDGNTVDMERERARFADNAVRYEASLKFMSNYVTGLKKAMQPE